MRGRALLALVLLGTAFGPAEHALAEVTDRQAIEAAYDAWARAADAKDMDAWLTFLARDALFLPPDSPALSTRESIRRFYARLFSDPLFSIKCAGLRIDVAASGEMAWSTGTCKATFSGPNGEGSGASTKWLKVWRKEADGQWRCAVNTWNPIGDTGEH